MPEGETVGSPIQARALDAGIAAVVLVTTTAPLLSQERWWSAAAAVMAALPLAWRRRAPLGVLAVVAVATTCLVVADALPPLAYGCMVATYTVAAVSTRSRQAVALGAGVPLLAFSIAVPGASFDDAGYTVMAFVAAWALGAGTRARQAAEHERLRRLEGERLAALARERTRIARDVHDIVTHAVGLIVVQAEAGPVAARTDPVRADAIFDTIADTGREAIGQLRRALGTLRSGAETCEPAPGLGALPALVERTRRAGIDVTLAERGRPRPVSADAGLAVYRVAQEALANVVRHSHATTVRVELHWTDRELRLVVADDGRGGSAMGGGHGLAGMRERMSACGGTLRATGGERGFVVRAALPLG
ncbi:sensor histidine kinase [Actinomadura formosensis]|uniref:sensor histidine kinase n=1 Tax=Actinomadura formosensis TaxID=60706 RepID=UPI003D93ECD3